MRTTPALRVALTVVLLASPTGAIAQVQSNVVVDGFTGSGWVSAQEGQELTGTTQGRIRVTGSQGGWTMMVANVSLKTISSAHPLYSQYKSLTKKYPWLVSAPTTVGASLGVASHEASLQSLVHAGDLAAASGKSMLVRPIDVHDMVDRCVDPLNHDPDEVKSWGQVMLGNQMMRHWVNNYEIWGAEPAAMYWLPTYARPQNGAELWADIDWFRLMESAVLSIAGYNQLLDFTRSGDVVAAAAIGLSVALQAVTLAGNSPPPATTDPGSTPGLVNVDVANLPRFTITQPIVIAIPFTPPLVQTLPVAYTAGIVNLLTAGPGDTVVAAVGYTTSATHALFFDGTSNSIQVPLQRLYFGGPIAMFQVPWNAMPGQVEFADLIGPNESAAFPISGYSYDLPTAVDDNPGSI